MAERLLKQRKSSKQPTNQNLERENLSYLVSVMRKFNTNHGKYSLKSMDLMRFLLKSMRESLNLAAQNDPCLECCLVMVAAWESLLSFDNCYCLTCDP